MSFTWSGEPLVADDLKRLSVDGERVLCRGWRDKDYGNRHALIAVQSALERPTASFLGRLAHEYELRNELDPRSAVVPLALVREHGRNLMLLDDPGGELLAPLLGRPMEMGGFLRLAIGISVALRQVHERGLIHKDIKPANMLVDFATGQVWLTGFGIASLVPRERQSPEPPELVAGTLAYMAPEQTGRMNRSIDSRSDLYSLGVTLYEMLTGALPFMASDPMEWVHCHIAKQPTPPVERLRDVPVPVSAIVSKLLAKTAEERYQTAAGLEYDLRHCLAALEAQHRIEAFPLGKRDTPDRLLIPEKLYGRGREIEALLAAFERVVTSGRPELLLVSGYSGIGKSAVVNELHKVLVPPRGLFASGKFDQYKRDIPYATLAQAFRSLVRRLLGRSEAELQIWREHLQRALDPNGSLIIDLVPELKLIIGTQPPVPDLPPQDAQNRFQLVFRRFINVFARSEHPLALFLDDLQWLDSATLDLLEDLLAGSDLRHLLLIGAYRNNEVDTSHALTRKLEAIKSDGGKITEITLSPLANEHVEQLIADALRCKPVRAAPLAQLVHKKTGGSPFFVVQFLHALAEEGLLYFDHEGASWCWALNPIHAKSYTDNVVDLMIGKLTRLPAETHKALQYLACLGSFAEIKMLAVILQASEDHVHAVLWAAARNGLIERLGDSYAFVHDRIREATYSLIEKSLKAEIHRLIGRLLVTQTPQGKREEAIFEIVNQLNRGAALISLSTERDELAELNLTAGKRAKAAIAYASASAYLAAGMALMGDDSLDDPRQYELAFALYLERAECEVLSGNFDEAERLILQLIRRGASKVDKAAAYSVRIHLHLLKSEKQEGVDAALECLQLLGIEMQPHPTRADVQVEYELVWKNLKGQSIGSLVDLPIMTDQEMQAAMRVLAFLTGPALYTDLNLYHLHFCKMVNLSLRYGISDASTFGYAGFGVMLCVPFQRYAEGHRFAKLACDLVDRHNFATYKAKVYLSMEMAALWTQPIEVGIELIRTAFRAGVESGDLAFACYSCMHLVTDLLIQGARLDEVWRESEICLDFVRKGKYIDAADVIISQQQLIRNLQGLTTTFSTFSDEKFDEKSFEARLTVDRMTPLVSRYWILKVQARFMSGDYRAGLAAAENARRLHWSSEAFLHSLDYHYYFALTVAALFESGSPSEQIRWRELLTAHREQLRQWADSCPPTFAGKHALVSAEIARLEGRDADAMRLYEEAIQVAREHGFVQNEGIGNEVAARFYAARGADSIAHACLRNARYCYLRWGADGKVRQLDRLYPQLTAPEGHALAANTGTPLQQLDVASVVKASQAVSSEIVLSKLIERLMTIALENAGADRGLLILPVDDDHLIQAKAKATGDQVEVVLCQNLITSVICPESIVRYVIRTHESVILDDASRPNIFSEDNYLRGRPAKSILCLPLIKQGRLTALLYLENTLSSHAFPPDRIAVLELLAAQAAISLENTRLYSDLQEREAKVRRLVDSNIIGIFIWDFDGHILEANDAFLHMLRYGRDDLAAGRIRWTDLTPPEWHDVDARLIEQQKTSGRLPPFEKEYFRKDGSRVPVLIGTATFEEGGNQGVAYVLDLTERKEVEKSLRESERRYREAQTELAHVTRVATLGELTASIAHEVNQPLAAVVNAAAASLRWLDHETPNLDEARRATEWIIKEGERAGEVIRRVRALVNKTDTQKTPLDINRVVNEAIALVQGELIRHGVSSQIEVAPFLPAVFADRVQLQQVIINLVMNGIEAMELVTDRPRELVVRSYQDEANQVRVTVEDCGIGISAENADRLFNTFFTTKAKGMGMGLSICRSIIETHGGRLSAANNAGPGATFQFTLPLRDKDSP